MPEKVCPACGRAIVWAVHERTRRRAPFDPGLVEGGNVELRQVPRRFDGPLYVYRIVPKREREADPRPHHVSHFVTCSDPGRFRQGNQTSAGLTCQPVRNEGSSA